MTMKPIDLIPHPEGGRFREVFRSTKIVLTGKGERSALTHIYFSLRAREVSRFHKVASDEVWNLYQGKGLYLYTWNQSDGPPVRNELSANNDCFCHVVPAGAWQAAEPIADEVLVGCSVAPGFEYSDFTLIDADSEVAELLLSLSPEMARFIIS